jgi:hypothetical protein
MRSTRRIAVSVLLALMVLALPVLAAVGSVPVLVGKVAELDACPALGQVGGFDPQTEGLLEVRTGPGAAHAIVDKLAEGRRVFICDDRVAWIGIVYSNEPGDVDCGVGSPRDGPEPYTGPCRAGWVHSHWIKVIAG